MPSDLAAEGLSRVLHEARSLGFLGGRISIEQQIAHSVALGRVATELLDVAGGRAADLGSGGGVPSLVLAVHYPGIRWTLIESQKRKSAFLRESVEKLGLSMVVIEDRAENVGRDPEFREQFDVVTARSFASPGVTAECSSPLVRVGGIVVVSEPPESTDRWPGTPLRSLGLSAELVSSDGMRFCRLTKTAAVDEEFPRRVGVPSKRPLF